jgi:DNA polymerase III alpha subunit (gram-positive type)
MSKEKEIKKWWRDFGVGQLVIDTLDKNKGKYMIIFDTETTGLTADSCHVIQISAIKCLIEDDYQIREVDRLDTYINPGYRLPKKIIEVTGITDALLAKYPNEATQWPSICDFFKGVDIVCGHNVPFDINFMTAMYMRNNTDSWKPVALDTLKMAQELHLKKEAGNHKLGTLAEHFGLDYGLTFHNSMDDVIATMRLLRLFIEEYLEKKAEEENAPEKQIIKTKVKNCWAWTGYRGMQRLYVKVWHEDRVLWMNQRRPYEWGEKDQGSLELFDIKDIEQQVLKLYGCETLDELSKVRESKYAR